MTGTTGSLADIRRALLNGMVIPAHPLALTPARRLDERRQRALTRYYCAAGAGGIAVGVHTTDFAIRRPSVGLLRPVLELASETVHAFEQESGRRILRVAGVCGRTEQAVREAELAAALGYDVGLVSLAAYRDADLSELVRHCRAVAAVIPLFGFYLQPAVGGRVLDTRFWRGFLEIENVVAVKVAPFNRYQTLDVLRAGAESGRTSEVAFYTGNDDSIIQDLLTPYWFRTSAGADVCVRFAGGLLGQWAVWTRRAVEFLDEIRALREDPEGVSEAWLVLGAQLTDANAAIFDAATGFAGCLPGILEVLRRQGLLRTRVCLDPEEDLSPGQAEEIDRVIAAYPQLQDDEFVAVHLDQWLS
ncbi:MAG: dihydrodipicolinate synthase family protein [Kiritimatiellaeota bacterium]|nr:dihydrodipicolinate synthase family protein [Kiritimatiellota bacterium]